MKIGVFLTLLFLSFQLQALQQQHDRAEFKPLNEANWQPRDDGRVYALPELWRKFKFSWNRTQQKEQQAYEKLIAQLQKKLDECSAVAAQEEAYYAAKQRIIARLQKERLAIAVRKEQRKAADKRFKAMSNLQKTTDASFEEMLAEQFLSYTSAYPLSVEQIEEIYQLERSLWHKKIAEGSLMQNNPLSEKLSSRLLSVFKEK